MRILSLIIIFMLTITVAGAETPDRMISDYLDKSLEETTVLLKDNSEATAEYQTFLRTKIALIQSIIECSDFNVRKNYVIREMAFEVNTLKKSVDRYIISKETHTMALELDEKRSALQEKLKTLLALR